MVGSLALGGCFQSTTVMKINADGSGTLEETVAISKAGLAQMQQFAALGGRGAKGLSDPLSEEHVRGAATALGSGVTYVGSRPVQTAEGEGRAITYAFKDVSQIGMSRKQPMSGVDTGGRGSSGQQEVHFEMAHRPNGNAVLIIRLPEEKTASTFGRGGDPTSALPQQFPIEQLGVMKQMFVGAKLAVAVEPNGRVVKSTSPFVEGQTVTLLDLDFNQLMNNDTLFARLARAHTMEETRVLMKDVPGLKVDLDPEISIEFTPAR